MKKQTPRYPDVRLDNLLIGEIIREKSSVLDLGCGSGELLSFLTETRNIRGQGIEIDEQAIYECVKKNLSVFHGDIDTGLSEYPDKSFDYVVLNQSLQQVIHVRKVMEEALRVGEKTVVGFPNFAHIRARSQLFFRGRAPVTEALPFRWYNSPNLHFLSITDFNDYCISENLMVDQKIYIRGGRRIYIAPNLLADSAIFLISGKKDRGPAS